MSDHDEEAIDRRISERVRRTDAVGRTFLSVHPVDAGFELRVRARAARLRMRRSLLSGVCAAACAALAITLVGRFAGDNIEPSPAPVVRIEPSTDTSDPSAEPPVARPPVDSLAVLQKHNDALTDAIEEMIRQR